VATTEPPQPYTEISLKAQGQRVPVIMYHDVLPDKNVWFDTTTEEFEQQMKWIADQGITPISLDQLYRHLTQGEQVPDKSIVLTFDDNYQGFHDQALPILEKYKFPAAMFVHTHYVGDKSGKHPKMDWPTLKELIKNPLITIGSHTVTHPADITQLAQEDQIKELTESKATLEKELEKPMPYLAYPDGKNDKTVQENARSAGYKMAFTMENTPAEESPNIMCVGRYIQTRIEKAWDDRDEAVRGGALGIFRGEIHDAPITYKEGSFAGTKLALVIGGTPQSLMSPTREGVLDFIHRTPGAVAGINGGFFAMAAINSSDNQMVGPCKTHEQESLVPDVAEERWKKLHNRPVILWGPRELAIVPFEPGSVNSDAAFKDFMPDYTDAFLTGVWLVHGGIGRTQDDMGVFASRDIVDPRRRAFLGIDAEGHIVLGASTESATSEMVAKAAAAAGVQEAVLLDSGFSTSLVYGEDVKASGHSTDTIPSRPVPHAIVLIGTLDPVTAPLGVSTFKPGPPPDERPHRRRRRRRKQPDETAPPPTEGEAAGTAG
jgi:peptidoglycan/xylan/chitin deacetylase (PgdA/CDA1 family)